MPGKRVFAADDRIAFTRIDREIGVKKGMLGIVIMSKNGAIAGALDGDTRRWVRFDPQQFRLFDRGYQGSAQSK